VHPQSLLTRKACELHLSEAGATNAMDGQREDGTSQGWGGMDLLWKAGSEAVALVRTVAAMPLRPVLPRSSFDTSGRHQTPVVFVHGFLGDPTNFVRLQGHLHEHGIRNWTTFAYRPRLDYPRLAPRLLDDIEALRRETGAAQVDVVAHSLGGLIARYLIETGHGDKVRRLVTLGSPWFTHPNPAQELAIFGGDDALVPARAADPARRDRMLVVPDCGHLGLLFDPRVLQGVATFLTRPARVPRVRALAA